MTELANNWTASKQAISTTHKTRHIYVTEIIMPYLSQNTKVLKDSSKYYFLMHVRLSVDTLSSRP